MKTKQPPKDSQLKHRMDYSFRRFRLGLALFFVGFVILYAADQVLEPSLYQEIVAGLAVLIIGLGFGLAVVAEILFIAYRVWLFFSTK